MREPLNRGTSDRSWLHVLISVCMINNYLTDIGGAACHNCCSVMKIKAILASAIVAVAMVLGVAQSSNNSVFSSDFSTSVAEQSYVLSGDMNANVSVEDQYATFNEKGEKLAFAASLGCSTSCSSGCTASCSGCCSHKCSGKCR